MTGPSHAPAPAPTAPPIGPEPQSPGPFVSTTGVVPVTTPISPTTAPASAGVSSLLGLLLSGAVLAALITAAVNEVLSRRKRLDDERARLRSTFAEAFECVVRYKEMPYAIRRRRSDAPGAERVRLSEELRDIQAKLSYYLMWTAGESTSVGNAYETLVENLRRVAGAACHDAWISQAASDDAGMNIGPDVVDVSELTEHEQSYVQAAQQHLDDFLRFHRLFGTFQRKH
jgi:hypothetical protein